MNGRTTVEVEATTVEEGAAAAVQLAVDAAVELNGALSEPLTATATTSASSRRARMTPAAPTAPIRTALVSPNHQ